jgi:hypothetical protein
MHHRLKDAALSAVLMILINPAPVLGQQKPAEPPPMPVRAVIGDSAKR